ncbi:MAG: TetR family transcriptional regulator [Anaerolineaceae bacterium]|nr:TetR family transcriptional regulator [Anaerolineaceae bacterium]
MNDVKPSLTHRQRQALYTQQLIIDAASELFLEQGYGVTTIDAISTKAGVAVSTVYAVFKNKRGILKAIREAWHQESGQREIFTRALNEADGAKRMQLAAHATRRQWETGGRMMAIYDSAAAVDAEAANERHEALSGRRKNLKPFISASLPLMRPELTLEKAHAVFLALTMVEIYRQLVGQFDWSPDEYEAWLTDTLIQQLLP